MPRPKSCPKCRSPVIVEIVYGLPGPELFEAASRGEVELGGCLVADFQPEWACRACGERFGARKRATHEESPG